MIIRLLLCLLYLALLPVAHAAQPSGIDEVTVPMQAVRLGTHSYFVQGLPGAASSENQGFMSNAGFVVTQDGVVVFDALASPPLADKLVGLIRRITRQPIRRVIVSHYHADHIYGLQAFKDAGATIIAHKEGQQYLNSETAALRLKASPSIGWNSSSRGMVLASGPVASVSRLAAISVGSFWSRISWSTAGGLGVK